MSSRLNGEGCSDPTLYKISRAASLLLLATSLATLAAHILGFAAVDRFPVGAPLDLNIHIAFVLLGVALWLVTSFNPLAPWQITVVRALAIAFLVIGATDQSFRIFHAKVDVGAAALGVLCLTSKKQAVRSMAQYIAIFIMLSASLSLLFDSYRLSLLEQFHYVAGLSWLSASCSFLAAVVLFFARCESGPAMLFAGPSLGARLARTMLFPLWFIIPILGIGTHSYEQGLTNLLVFFNFVLPAFVIVLAIGFNQQEDLQKRANDLLLTNEELNVQMAQLVLSESQARAALQAKQHFVANVSHELRTPLSAIIGATELSLGSPLSQEQRQLTRIAHDAAMTLLQLINNILDFSGLEHNNLLLHPVRCDVHQLVNSTAQALQCKASAKQLDFFVTISPDVPKYIYADQDRLKQILINLLDNAIKFTEQGQIQITVSGSHSSRGWVKFQVTDTGAGITPAFRAHMFDAFTQADLTATREKGGMGLGLATSKALVELMDGSMGVESEPGLGSSFWFTIPATASLERHCTTEPDRVCWRTDDVVLIVEDNAVNAKILQMQLSKFGCTSHIVSNGQQAVEAIKATAYALVLMDWQMPVMDGIAATAAIRKLPEPQAHCVPIVALTAHASSQDRVTCLNAGMNDYLSKPVSTQRLGEILHRWMPRAQTGNDYRSSA